MPATGLLIGTPASISASEVPHTVAIEDEPFELGYLGDDADRVGELVMPRHDRMHRAPGELAVADLAAPGAAHAPRLTDGEWREVVVEHEALFAGAFERVDELLVLARTQGRDDERLRLAAREQRRAVRARKDVHLRQDGANGLQVAPVDALARLDDVVANDVALQCLERAGEQNLLAGITLGHLDLGQHLLLGRGDQILTLLLLLGGEGCAQIGFGDLLDLGGVLLRVGNLDVPGLLRSRLGELDDRLDDGLELLVPEHHRFEHLLFGQLLGFQFDHHHRVCRSGDDQIEGGLGHLVEHGVQHELAADEADAGRRDRAEERQARQRQGRRGGDQAQDVGIVLQVVGEHVDDDLRLILEAFDEQRPDGPVDEAAGQRLLLRGTPLALEEAAGDLAGGIGLFLVVDGEGEKIDAGLWRFRADHGREHARLAVLRVNGGVRLASHAARLERQLAPAPFNFHSMDVEHVRSFVQSGFRRFLATGVLACCQLRRQSDGAVSPGRPRRNRSGERLKSQ